MIDLYSKNSLISHDNIIKLAARMRLFSLEAIPLSEKYKDMMKIITESDIYSTLDNKSLREIINMIGLDNIFSPNILKMSESYVCKYDEIEIPSNTIFDTENLRKYTFESIQSLLVGENSIVNTSIIGDKPIRINNYTNLLLSNNTVLLHDIGSLKCIRSNNIKMQGNVIIEANSIDNITETILFSDGKNMFTWTSCNGRAISKQVVDIILDLQIGHEDLNCNKDIFENIINQKVTIENTENTFDGIISEEENKFMCMYKIFDIVAEQLELRNKYESVNLWLDYRLKNKGEY